MNKTHRLLLAQCVQLGQSVLTIHEDMERFRIEPLSSTERTKLSVKLTTALSDQREILDAIIEEDGEAP